MQAGMGESRFKEGEKGQAPNNLFWVHPNRAKAAHLAPLLHKLCILAGSLSVPITPPDQNSRLIFKKAGTCSPLTDLEMCVCHCRLDKHATSTTSEIYRHLSANLNVEMGLLHFQSLHQEKSERKAVIGTIHTQPLLCQGGLEPTATAKKTGLDLLEIGREWEHQGPP